MSKHLEKWSKDLISGLMEILADIQDRQAIINNFLGKSLSPEDQVKLLDELKAYDNRDKEAIKKAELDKAWDRMKSTQIKKEDV